MRAPRYHRRFALEPKFLGALGLTMLPGAVANRLLDMRGRRERVSARIRGG